MRRSFILAGVAILTMLAASVCPRQCPAAGAARAGRRSRMPRRHQRRLHRRLGDQPRLRAARRGHAGGPLRRDHPQGRPRSRHHRRNRRWPGACMRRSPGSGPAISPGNYAGAQGSATVGVGARRQRAGRRLGQFDRAAAAQRAGPGRPQCRGRAGEPGTSAGRKSVRLQWSRLCAALAASFRQAARCGDAKLDADAAQCRRFSGLPNRDVGGASCRRPNQGPSSR